MSKKLDKVAVLVEACTLMLNNGQTTTLEVKNSLRKQGYDARQADVSAFMAELSGEEKWKAKDTGSYKVYEPGTTGLVVSKTTTVGIRPATVLTTKTSGCWEMNSTTSSKVVYMNGSVSREKARTADMNQVPGTAWADTRGRKVK